LKEAIDLRSSHADDIAFIIASWLRSYKHKSSFAKRIQHNIFYKWHEQVIKRILDRSAVLVAHMKDEPEIILAYIVFEPNTIHYIYTKDEWRMMGIAKALLDQSQVKFDSDDTYFTHWTYDLDTYFNTHHQRAKYDPYRI